MKLLIGRSVGRTWKDQIQTQVSGVTSCLLPLFSPQTADQNNDSPPTEWISKWFRLTFVPKISHLTWSVILYFMWDGEENRRDWAAASEWERRDRDWRARASLTLGQAETSAVAVLWKSMAFLWRHDVSSVHQDHNTGLYGSTKLYFTPTWRRSKHSAPVNEFVTVDRTSLKYSFN